MKSNEWIRKAEIEMNERRAHVDWLREHNMDYQRYRQNIFFMEDAIRTLGFTVKSKGVDGYEIKCKWSDAPEALKNGR